VPDEKDARELNGSDPPQAEHRSDATTERQRSHGPDLSIIRTPDHRVRVFVSSTLQELAPERETVRSAVAHLRLTPVLFELGARPHPPRSLYRAYLEQSHVFMGIYWQRYGWVAPEMEISGLEDEFNLSTDKPRLIYIKSPAPEREPRLQALLDRIETDSSTSYKHFSTLEELHDLVENDLALLLTEIFESSQRGSTSTAFPDYAPTLARAPSLPTGTVTFLYTDIESSTRRWDEYPAVMKAAVESHDAIMRRAIESRGGTVFRTMGDAFCASFQTAQDALQAAADAQRALAAEPWPAETGPIKVRMALHTGTGEIREGDYVGPHLNRIARLLSTGHGGQVLLTQATYELVCDLPIEGFTLQDMGEHRLKDLTRPERVYQALVAGLPTAFAPLKTLDSRPNNLPPQPTPFIGRQQELASLLELISRQDVRLVTLYGPGGTGKTRLAVQAAAELVDDFPDGVFFVDLAPIGDPSLVASEIAQTLGVPEAGEQPLIERLKDFLREKRLLLLLDNFEQVVEAGTLVSQLSQAAQNLKLLATSRAVLHLRGEKEFPVPPLQLPDHRHLPSLERLSQYEAVRLFIERARDAKPDFEVDSDNAPAVAEICYRLDGLPLAIELAAARIRVLPPSAMLARLQSRLKVLTGGARDRPARQQTLRGAIAWSYDLLEPDEKALFSRLGVFQGGATLDAIEAVCCAEGDLALDMLDGVSSLADKSLLRVVEGGEADGAGSGEPRFMMLETIREYALERLAEDGTTEEMLRRHARFFLALAEESEPQLFRPRQLNWIGRLEAEHGNLAAALEWSLESAEAGDVELGIRLAAALAHFWSLRGYYAEGRNWLARAVAVAPEGALVRAQVLSGAGYLAYFRGDPGEAGPLLEESVRLYRQLGSTDKYQYALGTFAAYMLSTARYQDARALLDETIQVGRDLGDDWVVAIALYLQHQVHEVEGDQAGARALLEESLRLLRKAGDRWGTALVLQGLAMQALLSGEYVSARAGMEEALALYRQLGDKLSIASMLLGLGHVAHAEGVYERAMPLFEQALSAYSELGHRSAVADALFHMAMSERDQSRYPQAGRLLERALIIYRQSGNKDMVATTLSGLAHVETLAGNQSRARTLLDEALAHFRETGNKRGMTDVLAGLSQLTATAGPPATAARLLGASDALLEAIGIHLNPRERAEFEQRVSAVRAQIGDEVFQAAWDEGRSMSLEQAIACALEEI
jgi:predicted ATPase